MTLSPNNSPDFLSIGHLSFDVHIRADGTRSHPEPGGAAAFAAMTAHNLGVGRVGMVSRAGPDYPLKVTGDEISRRIEESTCSTVFEDEVTGSHRRQKLLNDAGKISQATLGEDWRQVRLLVAGPLLGELPLDCREWFEAEFSCVIAQGWFREVGADGVIRHRAPDVRRIAGRWDVIVLSEQEAAAVPDLEEWRRACRMLAVTRGERGALVMEGAREVEIPAIGTQSVVDTTGAGDVWATAFSIHYTETGSVTDTGRFAAAAAAICVSRKGLGGVPRSREEVESVL